MTSRLDEIEGPSWAEWLARGVRAPGKAGAEGVKAAYGAWGDLQDRMINAMLQYNRGEGYDPGPALESAMLPVGGTGFSAPRGVLGAGLTSPFPKKMDPETAKALEKAGIKQGQSVFKSESVEPTSGLLAAFGGNKKAAADAAKLLGSTEDPTEKAMKAIYAALKEGSTSAKPTLASLPPAAPSIIRSKVPQHKFEPLDWQSQVSPTGVGVTLPEHARGMGFNPDFPFYKGRESGKPTLGGPMRDPATKDYERALFFAEHPEIARRYTPRGRGDITQYVARAENPAQVEFSPFGSASRSLEYSESVMHALVEAARARGHDLVKVKKIRDMAPEGMGRTQNQLIITKPEIIRHPTAAFDPSKLKTNDILAGLAALGIVPAATTQKGENNE